MSRMPHNATSVPQNAEPEPEVPAGGVRIFCLARDVVVDLVVIVVERWVRVPA
jgi:hypothetical protein